MDKVIDHRPVRRDHVRDLHATRRSYSTALSGAVPCIKPIYRVKDSNAIWYFEVSNRSLSTSALAGSKAATVGRGMRLSSEKSNASTVRQP